MLEKEGFSYADESNDRNSKKESFAIKSRTQEAETKNLNIKPEKYGLTLDAWGKIVGPTNLDEALKMVEYFKQKESAEKKINKTNENDFLNINSAASNLNNTLTKRKLSKRYTRRLKQR